VRRRACGRRGPRRGGQLRGKKKQRGRGPGPSWDRRSDFARACCLGPSALCCQPRPTRPSLPACTHAGRQGWRRILGVAALGALPAASFAALVATTPALVASATGATAPAASAAVQLAGAAVLAVAVPLGGRLADAAGSDVTLLTAAAAAAALAYPAWFLLTAGVPAVAWLGQLALVVAFGVFQGAAAEGGAMAMPQGVSARRPRARLARNR
jgi:hypothetical protein